MQSDDISFELGYFPNAKQQKSQNNMSLLFCQVYTWVYCYLVNAMRKNHCCDRAFDTIINWHFSLGILILRKRKPKEVSREWQWIAKLKVVWLCRTELEWNGAKGANQNKQGQPWKWWSNFSERLLWYFVPKKDFENKFMKLWEERDDLFDGNPKNQPNNESNIQSQYLKPCNVQELEHCQSVYRNKDWSNQHVDCRNKFLLCVRPKTLKRQNAASIGPRKLRPENLRESSLSRSDIGWRHRAWISKS